MKFSLASVVGVALISCTSGAIGSPSSVKQLEQALNELPDSAWTPHRAPTVEVEPSMSMAIAADATPVVFMHGMGDSGSNPGMKSLCACTYSPRSTTDAADDKKKTFDTHKLQT